jgi:hypothetical protein
MTKRKDKEWATKLSMKSRLKMKEHENFTKSGGGIRRTIAAVLVASRSIIHFNEIYNIHVAIQAIVQ